MPERKMRVPLGDTSVEVTDVAIRKRKEDIFEYELEDGSVIRLGLVVTAVLRMNETWDGDGNPLYIVKHGIVTNTLTANEELRRPRK
jgi:hypothetical protein